MAIQEQDDVKLVFKGAKDWTPIERMSYDLWPWQGPCKVKPIDAFINESNWGKSGRIKVLAVNFESLDADALDLKNSLKFPLEGTYKNRDGVEVDNCLSLIGLMIAAGIPKETATVQLEGASFSVMDLFYGPKGADGTRNEAQGIISSTLYLMARSGSYTPQGQTEPVSQTDFDCSVKAEYDTRFADREKNPAGWRKPNAAPRAKKAAAAPTSTRTPPPAPPAQPATIPGAPPAGLFGQNGNGPSPVTPAGAGATPNAMAALLGVRS